MYALDIQQLRKTYANGVEALKGINLKVDTGDFFALLGPNGAGKTTTLKMLTTLLEPDSGSAFIAGFDVKKDPEEVRKRIGYVSQSGGADRDAKGIENLILQGQLYGMSLAEAKKRASEVFLKAASMIQYDHE